MSKDIVERMTKDIVERLRGQVDVLEGPPATLWLMKEAADEIERERGRSDYFIEHGIHLAKTIRELEKICPNVPRHFWLSAKKSYSVFMQEEADWLKRRVEWEKECFGDPPTPVFGEKK